MNIQELGSLGEFIAAIATIVTLIYLALQIRQNTRTTKDQITHSLVMANSEATFEVAKDGEMADLLLRGIYERPKLTATEQLRFNCFFFSYYNQVEWAYEQFLAGKLDARSWEKIASEIPAFIGSPGVQEWWSEDKIRFSPMFVEYVERALKEAEKTSNIPSVPPLNKN